MGPKNGTEESRSTLCFLDRTGVCVNLSTLGVCWLRKVDLTSSHDVSVKKAG